MAFIDTHVHFWDLKRHEYPNYASEPSFSWPGRDEAALYSNFGPEDVVQEMAQAGVKGIIFVQVINDSPEEAKWVAQMAKRHDIIKGIVAGFNLTKHEKLKRSIQDFRTEFPGLLVGVRHILDFEEDDYLLRTDVQAGLEILEEEELVFDLVLRPRMLCQVPSLAKRFPRLTFVIDHMAKPVMTPNGEGLSGWREDMTAAAAHPNVHCKLSGLVTECFSAQADPGSDPGSDLASDPGQRAWSGETIAPFASHCLQVFGVHRCLFGSDWPVCKLARAEYGGVVALFQQLTENYDETERDKLRYQNAITVYKLKM